MNHIEIIQQHVALTQKVLSGKKLTKDEKDWFATNPTFNEKYENPIYQKDVLSLSQNTSYNIKVTLEHIDDNVDMIPIFSIVLGKGKIHLESLVLEGGSNNSSCVKSLGLFISKEQPTVSFVFETKNGYMRIEYQCEYYDPKMKLHKRETSVLNFGYGMKKEVVSENKIIYKCKHPLAEYGDFSSLVFSVEWNKIVQSLHSDKTKSFH